MKADIKSRFIGPPGDFSKKVNKGEKHYRDAIDKKRTNKLIKGWTLAGKKTKFKYIEILKRERIWPKYYGSRVLELGAGSCWFSSILSRENSVKEIYCVDLSENLLKNVAPHVMKSLNAKEEKITRVLNDYDNLKFKQEFFDSIAFDASIHHSKDVVHTFMIANKVLKKGGYIIAHREPVLPLFLPFREKKRKKFSESEGTQYGVTERTHTLKEWKKLFKKAGFNVKQIAYNPFEIHPATNTRRRIMNLLFKNKLIMKSSAGYFHGGIIFIARKK